MSVNCVVFDSTFIAHGLGVRGRGQGRAIQDYQQHREIIGREVSAVTQKLNFKIKLLRTSAHYKSLRNLKANFNLLFQTQLIYFATTKVFTKLILPFTKY